VYVGDPINTVRIFNELLVDELFIMDINATTNNSWPNLKLLRNIANECFMPLGSGGGISTISQAKAVFDIGFEKILLNSYAIKNPELISQIASVFGSQALVISIDVKKSFFSPSKTVWTKNGKKNTYLLPKDWAKEAEKLGAGEILLTDIKREGSWSGFDLELLRDVSSSVSIPVVAHGGAGNVEHIEDAIQNAGVSAIAIGSMVVFQKKGMGVLVNMPDINSIKKKDIPNIVRI
jgi:cyclase